MGVLGVVGGSGGGHGGPVWVGGLFGGVVWWGRGLGHMTTTQQQISFKRSLVQLEILSWPSSKSSQERGTGMLIHNDFSWTKKNDRKDKVTVWRCSCRGSAKGCSCTHP